MGEEQDREKWWALPKPALATLIQALQGRGYRVIGPLIREGAIVYDEIATVACLARGYRDRLAPGSYRLEPGEPERYFDHTAGPSSWKSFVHPPRRPLFVLHQEGQRIETPAPTGPAAFLGVRACELAALSVLRKAVPYPEQPFLVAVECMRAGELCFCASMNTGPSVGPGYDLALDELEQLFLVRSGTPRGEEVLDDLPLTPALPSDVARARKQVAETANHMGRKLETEGLREVLLHNPEHSRWSEVANRCMACANCTMVCPTCFCTTVEDHTDLSGRRAERVELWDSCFNLDFTYTNGQPARGSVRARYRHWLTHKLASWHDQFGTSGCVGCGRCIAWCPVGIDLTEEAAALRQESTS